MDIRTCCICGAELEFYGNNAAPLLPDSDKDGREMKVCETCNWRYVVPVRIAKVQAQSSAERNGYRLQGPYASHFEREPHE